jgi:NADH dehydrogenase [ubiquinone] 1 alpha subcomplex assembly factor 7
MTLAALLARQIAATGPMRLSDYMAACLFHPTLGYYTNAEPFGTAGDFTTAPEISQMFGELGGLALAQAWMDQGSPAPFALVELGPGRGTLMADALRATRGVPGFHAAMQLYLVEASPRLRQTQARLLAGHGPRFCDRVDDLPRMPVFLIANEFFDALPIRQFTRVGDGWAETVVGLTDGRLTLGRARPAPLGALQHRLADTQDGDVVETCPAAVPIIAHIGAGIAAHGGAGVIIDYGGWRSRGDTFQAMRHHGFADPMAAPGQADLTAHVDFQALVAAAGCGWSFTTQGRLLEALGIAARCERLAAGLTGARLAAHYDAADRLTSPSRMGDLFKALAIYPNGQRPPPGFPDADADHI